MSVPPTVTIVLRDEERLIYLEDAIEWQLLLLLGALSISPRSFDDFTDACTRYLLPEEMTTMQWKHLKIPRPFEEWILIDLVQQRIVASDAKWLFESPEVYEADQEWETIGTSVVWINIPPWWRREVRDDWKTSFGLDEEVDEPFDFRRILFGRPLAQGIAKRVLAIDRDKLPHSLPRNFEYSEEESEQDLVEKWHAWTIQVHADWLMTPRPDLEGACPRFFLHRYREWKEMELQFRGHQWSLLRRPPTPLATDSVLYQFGPMGRDEVVIYFELCRAVVRAAWRTFARYPSDQLEQFTDELELYIEDWLQCGELDGEANSPWEVIDSERRLMPRAAGKVHIDCDCPICNMTQGEDSPFGLAFLGFDGHHLSLDDEFAFSLHENLEDWKAEQLEYEQFSDAMDFQLGDAGQSEEDEFSSVWKSSYVSDEAAELGGPQVSMLTLAFRLSELLDDLHDHNDSESEAKSLNGSFENLRQSVNLGGDFSLAATDMIDELERIAQRYPELTPKSADLQSTLHQMSRRRKGFE